MSSRLQGEVPIIDIGAFVASAGAGAGGGERRRAAVELGQACREHGFLYVVEHPLRASSG